MRKGKAFCNLYIILWLIYSLQSVFLGESESVIPTLIVLLLIGISFYHFVYALYNYKMPKYMKGLTVLVIMFTIYGVILILSGKTIRFMRSYHIVKNYSYIKKVYISILPVFSFYVFSRKGALTKALLQKWVILFFITCIFQFYQLQHKMLMMTLDGSDEFTNNYGYLFLSMIPLLFFWEHKKVVQFIGLGLSMAFIILGMKRGAILIGVLSLFVFLYHTLKTVSPKKKIWIFILASIVVVASVYLVLDMLQNSDYFNVRIEDTLEGNSSGRDKLYEFFWRHFINESNLLLFLFGNGANATLTIAWNYAHNDWLEIAINQGLFGLLIYAYYWITFYKTWRQSRFDNQIYLAVGLILMSFFMKTIFSMSYNDMTIYDTLCLGYCMAMVSEHDKLVLSNE